MKGLIILIVGSLFFSLGATANAKVKDFFLCSNKKITRTLRIDILPDKSCQTVYTKAGVDKTIASATHLESCEKILTNVKANLEEAGWNCRKANSVTVQTSN
jgi:hypothetical protein